MKRNIIITGTSKGLGYELALKYIEDGFRVIGCSRKEQSIYHEDYIHYTVDVTDEDNVKSMVRDVRKRFKTVDVLINNAGTAAMNHIVTTATDTVRKVFDTNFLGTFIFSREVAKLMVRERKGVIVNYSTVAVPLDLEGEAVYAASKSAIESFTRIAAKELGRFNIRVNAIGPSPIKTDLTRGVPVEAMNDLFAKQVFSRYATSDDVKNVFDFFISDKSEFVTGQIIYLGGVMK